MNIRPKTSSLYKLFSAFLIITALSLLAGCNVLTSDSYVWLGDPVITDRLDENGLPGKSLTNLSPPPTTVYCYLAIRGPADYKLLVRWYQDNQMISEEEVNFGETRRAAPTLTLDNGQPLPEGIYRCEYLLNDQVMRDVGFLVLE